MLRYYFGLALRSLKRNVMLTALMIAAIGVGIGASMTMMTVFRAMSGDPIPQKSSRLFAPQLDAWGPDRSRKAAIGVTDNHLLDQLSYTDATALMSAHAAPRQAAMYAAELALTPANPELRPFVAKVRATYGDFFAMFAVPMLYGAGWSAADDDARANVVVISRDLNDKLFGGADSIGRMVNLDSQEYRVVGVADHWDPLPRFYDLSSSKYAKVEDVFMPFTRAVGDHVEMNGNVNCTGSLQGGWDSILRSECVWIQFWVELPAAADVVRYAAFLNNYAADQRRAGRFQWPPDTRLPDVREWLAIHHVVLDEVRILVLVSFSFLFVCLLNAMGLMLAKVMGRISDISVRRALGADRRAIFAQSLIETAVVGVAGAGVGLGLTVLGLAGLRGLLSQEITRLTYLDSLDVLIAIVLSVAATMVAGLYPTWRATQVQPAWQLKAQ